MFSMFTFIVSSCRTPLKKKFFISMGLNPAVVRVRAGAWTMFVIVEEEEPTFGGDRLQPPHAVPRLWTVLFALKRMNRLTER